MAQNEAQKLQQKIGVTQTIQLVQPIETPNGTVTEVTTRRVLVKDYKQAAELYPNSAALQQIHVMALASGLMPEDFENMAWEDGSNRLTDRLKRSIRRCRARLFRVSEQPADAGNKHSKRETGDGKGHAGRPGQYQPQDDKPEQCRPEAYRYPHAGK